MTISQRVRNLLGLLREALNGGSTSPPSPAPIQASITLLIGEALVRQSAKLGITESGTKVHILHPGSNGKSYCGQNLHKVTDYVSIGDHKVDEICQRCYQIYKEDPNIAI